jgi:hypothetical protein
MCFRRIDPGNADALAALQPECVAIDDEADAPLIGRRSSPAGGWRSSTWC